MYCCDFPERNCRAENVPWESGRWTESSCGNIAQRTRRIRIWEFNEFFDRKMLTGKFGGKRPADQRLREQRWLFAIGVEIDLWWLSLWMQRFKKSIANGWAKKILLFFVIDEFSFLRTSIWRYWMCCSMRNVVSLNMAKSWSDDWRTNEMSWR